MGSRKVPHLYFILRQHTFLQCLRKSMILIVKENTTMNHTNAVTQFSRKCPKCGGIVYHQSKKDRDRREREGRTCGGKTNLNCKVMSAKQKKTLSRLNTGKCFWKKYSATRRLKLTPTAYSRPCPKCSTLIYYSHDKNRRYAESKQLLCMSCTAIRDDFQSNRSTPSSIHQMRATKAGFKDWSEYCRMFPKWKRYKAEVWRHTYKSLRDNPTLENFSLRGKCGVDGAYQIDHIKGVREGFDKGTDPTAIGAYTNLRMLPWRDNLKKK